MTSAIRASTPSPPPMVRTPPAPRLGYHDNWEPYSPRKSTRISSQRTANRTPSPRAPQRLTSGSPPNKRHNERSDAAMVSPMPSPQKKSQPKPASSRRVSGALTAEGTANAASVLGLADTSAQDAPGSDFARATGMLPTPAKTPQKAPNEKTAAHISTFARNLFPQEAAMSSPRKKRAKKYSGLTLESFTAEDVEDPIEIFVDSQDRIPQRDDSESNPFLEHATVPSQHRRSKRRQVVIPGEGAKSVEEASHRDDGMVYVFRGKRFFRKFSETEDASSRAAVKPRVLFKTDNAKITEEEEEAPTDVEDLDEPEIAAPPQTPVKVQKSSVQTPDAPRFGPLSPPDTRRVTRSTNKLLDDGTPMKTSGRRSPFDHWPRTKEHKETLASKRQGDDLTSEHAKRTRA